jgi:AcrR family transcriptional regulator
MAEAEDSDGAVGMTQVSAQAPPVDPGRADEDGDRRRAIAPTHETRGRPRIRQDDEILDAALQAFAAQGYDAMSLRSLNAHLGLSHGTISQRFGTKERLYFAAIDRGFATFVEDIDLRRRHLLSAIDPPDDLWDLRATIRAFLGAALQRPELGRMMNQEGLADTPRLRYIVDTVMVPLFGVVGELLGRLRAAGRIRPVTTRGLFFLVGHGAEAPYTLTALSEAFDGTDGPLDPEQHADDMTDLLLRGITYTDADAPEGATASLRLRAGPPPPVGPTPFLDALRRS